MTLLEKNAPSGRSHWVLVRIEDGISAGKETEVPSQSLYHLPGAERPQRPKIRKPEQSERRVPPGWLPRRGEAVAWTQTLGSRCTVVSVDPRRGVARVEGVVLGVTKQFDAPVPELSPYRQPELIVHDGDIEDRLGDRLPEKPRAQERGDQTKPRRTNKRGPNYELVSRFVFSSDCIEIYRKRFARQAGKAEAERRLRHELEHDAKKVRSHPREYVRLQVEGRFEVPLLKRPPPLKPARIERLVLAAKPQRRQRRKAA